MSEPSQPAYGGKRILEAMHGATRYAQAVFAEVHAAMPKEAARVLDFGAGDAVFADKFRARGIEVECVEPDPDLRAALQAKSVPAFADIAEIGPAAFDFVYTINVLEHIGEVGRSCAELHRVLRPGGTLFIFVPAFEVLWTSLDDEVGHVRRFTRASLSGVLEQAGFVIEGARFFDSLGFPALLGVRVMEAVRMFRYDAGSIGVYDRYIFPVSQQLDRLARRVFGKNLIAVARKA